VRGICRQKDTEILMIFNMKETEIFISQNETSDNEQLLKDSKPFANGQKKAIVAYPVNWANTFGSNYYSQIQARELSLLNEENEWKAKEQGKPYSEPDLEVTNPNEIQINIKKIISDMKQEAANDGE